MGAGGRGQDKNGKNAGAAEGAPAAPATDVTEASLRTGIPRGTCRAYLGDLDYQLSYRHLAGLTEFFGRLAKDGLVPNGSLTFLTAA